MEPTENLLRAIAVAAELTATQLSQPAARVMAEDLARYPELSHRVRHRAEVLQADERDIVNGPLALARIEAARRKQLLADNARLVRESRIGNRIVVGIIVCGIAIAVALAAIGA